MTLWRYLIIPLVLLSLFTCKKSDTALQSELYPYQMGQFDGPKLMEHNWMAFDELFSHNIEYVNDLGLCKMANYYKRLGIPENSFGNEPRRIQNEDYTIDFLPLGQPPNERYEYTHVYRCKYQPEFHEYANIAYPDPCPKKKYAQGLARIVNHSSDTLKLRLRMFFQNTSYWYPTDERMNLSGDQWYNTNYYGGSDRYLVIVPPGDSTAQILPYIIGKDPKDNSYPRTQLYGPARPGNYEFMLWVDDGYMPEGLWSDTLVLWKENPFSSVRKSVNDGRDSLLWNRNVSYVPAKHFRFKLLNERFDGRNILEPGWVYFLAERDHKDLCDSCNGDSIWTKDIVRDNWLADDFFEGDIHESKMIKVPYGNRYENVKISNKGVLLRIPSSEYRKQKTWGEFKFKPAFTYGKLKVVAKLAQLRNKATTPTGIIHNLWLYQKNYPRADTLPNNPYNFLGNGRGKQPYEIDMEIWSKIYEEPWKDVSYVNYSIVDYMRDPNVLLKPGEKMFVKNGQEVDRFNDFQMNYPSSYELDRNFFEDYHLFEIEWKPDVVNYYIDGKCLASISGDLARIPDQPCNVWINSPIYQDGTYYNQQHIPMLESDHFTHIRYLSIE